MTKVQVRYDLTKAIDETLMDAVNRAHAIYGILQVKLDKDLKGMTVEYDASRLSVLEVDNALGKAGLPIQRVAV